MIRYLQNSEIDKTLWDNTISQYGNVYAYSWYLDIVHPNWEALVEDDYAVLMPLTAGHKFGVGYLYQPYFAQQLGIFSKCELDAACMQRFLSAIPTKYRFAEIRLNEGNVFDDTCQGIEYHRNTILDLNSDYETLRAGYHSNTKRNLAKAEANNLQLVHSVIPYHVVALFRDNRGANLGKWGDKEYAVLQKVTAEAMRRGKAFILGVNEIGVGTLLSAAIFMQTDKRITFLFSGNNAQAKEKQSMTFLIDQVIRQNAGRDIVFDFEGSDDDNLARFYLGFGGHEVRYPSYTFNHLSAIGKTALKCWKKFRH